MVQIHSPQFLMFVVRRVIQMLQNLALYLGRVMIKLAMIVSFCVATSASAAEFNSTHRIDKLEASTGLALKPTADLDQARSREFRWESSAGFWGSLVGLAITTTIIVLAVNAADKDNSTPYEPMEHSSH